MILRQFERITRSYTQHILAPRADVFTLLCPVRESEWLEDFNCDIIYSESGVAEDGCVFRTKVPCGPETIWMIVRHSREQGAIEFARITVGLLATRLQIQLSEAENDTTSVRIAYTFTPISEEGETFARMIHSEEAFLNSVKWWERSMNHFIETGRMLRKSEPVQA